MLTRRKASRVCRKMDGFRQRRATMPGNDEATCPTTSWVTNGFKFAAVDLVFFFLDVMIIQVATEGERREVTSVIGSERDESRYESEAISKNKFETQKSKLEK